MTSCSKIKMLIQAVGRLRLKISSKEQEELNTHALLLKLLDSVGPNQIPVFLQTYTNSAALASQTCHFSCFKYHLVH